MKNLKLVIALVILFAAMIIYCDESNEHSERNEGKSEESGDDFTLTENCDIIRNGIRLILKYDSKNNVFIGTIENITPKKLEKVRVEIHLSNGVELNDGKRFDLEVGEKVSIKLTTIQKVFIGWSAHPEVGDGEHNNEKSGHRENSNEHEQREKKHE